MVTESSHVGFLSRVIHEEMIKTLREPLRIRHLFNKHKRRTYLNTQRLKLLYFSPWSYNSPKQMVEEGYDCISDQYAEWSSKAQKAERARCIAALLRALPQNTDLLDLGCGTGVPSTKMLAERFSVTGVDISAESIRRSRQNVPTARFIQADMVKLNLPPDSFDVVTAFYSIFHIPRREQSLLLNKIVLWLRCGGLFVANVGATSMRAFVEQKWMGIPMYWSSFDAETNKRLLEKTGMKVIRAQEMREKTLGKWNTFLWIIAQKPGLADNKAREKSSTLIHLLSDFQKGPNLFDNK